MTTEDMLQMQLWDALRRVYVPAAEWRPGRQTTGWRIARESRPLKPRYYPSGWGGPSVACSRSPGEVRAEYLQWAKDKGLTGVTLWVRTPWTDEQRAAFPDTRFVTKDEHFRVTTEHDTRDYYHASFEGARP